MLTLFSIIDIGKDLGKRYINTSELGSPLLERRAIPRHTFIMDVWTAHPAHVTYEWFKSLRKLLHIFQKWTMYQHMKADHGCEEFSSGFSAHGRDDAWSHSWSIVFSDHRT